ncbi:MAG: zinc-dependent metalloprotease family protein [Saprospiraceae bacterium]
MKQVSILKLISFILLFCLASSGIIAQNYRLTGKQIQGYSSPVLKKSFERSSVFQIELSQILKFVSKEQGSINLAINFAGIPSLEARLQPSNIVADNYTNVIGKDNGVITNHDRPNVFPFISKRNPVNQSQVALTFGEGFLYGFFEANGSTWYVEPLRYFDRDQANDLFVVYEKSDVIEGEDNACGMLEVEKIIGEVSDRDGPQPVSCGPPELELAIANKWNMVTFYGSAAAVADHNIGVYNEAQANWDDEFVKPVLFQIVTQFIPTSLQNDPFTNTSNGHTLLGELQVWAEAGGFGTSAYDLGHVRTRSILYNPSGNVLLGATYLSQLCTPLRYSSFSEYNLSACKLRHVVSHEMGHSFSALHYTPPYNIMAPSLIGCSDIWHVDAIAAINNFIENSPCLTPSVCPLPPFVPMPIEFDQLCTGTPECFTFEDNPCVASYAVSTNDPYLQVTSNGNTICINSTAFVARVATVIVTPLDYCGNPPVYEPGEILPIWVIHVDFDPRCTGGLQKGDVGNRNETAIQNELSVYEYQEVLNIVDLSTTLRNKEIQVFDMNGRLLLEEQSFGGRHQVFLDNMPVGMLVVKVNAGDELVTKRVMKF